MAAYQDISFSLIPHKSLTPAVYSATVIPDQEATAYAGRTAGHRTQDERIAVMVVLYTAGVKDLWSGLKEIISSTALTALKVAGGTKPPSASAGYFAQQTLLHRH